MIRAICLFALFLCLYVPPVRAEVWLFNGKKEDERPAVTPGTEKPSIFIKPKDDDGQKGWVLDNMFNRPKTQTQALSPIFDKKLFEKLTPEMLTVAYTPKTTEEIGMIAVAQNMWEIGAVADMQEAAKIRMAEAQKELQAQIRAMNAGKNLPSKKKTAQAPPRKSVDVYNKPGLKTPPKVFKNYR